MQGCHIKKLLCLIILGSLHTSTYANAPMLVPDTSIDVNLGVLFLQPQSNNLKYAVFVAGHQPTSQSWHNQAIDPHYSTAFELGLGVNYIQALYNASINWLHLDTSDSSSKQANRTLNPGTLQFVAPPYDVGPAVFGIKHAASTAKFNFDNVLFNFSRLFEYCPGVKARVFGGLDFLHVNQTISTTFDDFPGVLPTPISYGLPPDPSFYFNTKNRSDYIGAGPDVGLSVQYINDYGFGFIGQFMGAITAGRMSVKDKFTSASQRLAEAGIQTSQQSITAPDFTQVVPGVDAKFGLTYDHLFPCLYNLSFEFGYRLAYYFHAISDVNPGTLVQARDSSIIPEFATGTMAINSTDARDRPFTFNGPYLNLKITL